MPAKKKEIDEGTTLVCGDCGHETSGPDEASVKEAHARHQKKTGHKK